MTIDATRTRQVGPNKIGAKGPTTTYRIVSPSHQSGSTLAAD